MPKTQETLKIGKSTAKKWLAILIVAVVVAGGWLWWSKVYTSPSNVFWGMINNNLATASITRHTVQSAGGQTTDQYIQTQYGAVNAARSIATVSQQTSAGKTVVKSETIGTPTYDYSRYISISTTQKNAQGKPLDTSKVVGAWGVSPGAKPGQRAPVQYFQQGLLAIVPYGDLPSGTRHDLVQLMHDDNVYTLGSTSPKSDKFNGRPVFVYDVSISPQAYIGMMQQFVKDIGLGDIGLNPTQYAGSAPLKAQFTIDKASRQLVKLAYPATGQSELLSAQGLEQPIGLPTQTIPIQQLQAKIQNLQ